MIEHIPGPARGQQSHLWERIAIFVFGTVFLVTLMGVAIAIPTPTQFEYTVFKTVLAIAAAGVAALMPGFFQIQYREVIRAGGAVAVFLIVYFVSPVVLVTVPDNIFPDVRPQKPKAEPVSWWSGDGTANNQSGGANGVISGNVTFSVGLGGKHKAFDFNGGSVQAASGGLPIGDADRTLELWVNLKTYPVAEAFFAGYGKKEDGKLYALGYDRYGVFFTNWGEAVRSRNRRVGTLDTGRWHHVVITTNSRKTCLLFLDGEQVGQEELTKIDTPERTEFYVGKFNGDASRTLIGLIQNVRVYDQALNPGEIKFIYNATKPI